MNINRCTWVILLIPLVAGQSSWRVALTWPGGSMGELCTTPEDDVTDGWKATMTFKPAFDILNMWDVWIIHKTSQGDSTTFTFVNKDHKSRLRRGEETCMTFVATRNDWSPFSLTSISGTFQYECSGDQCRKSTYKTTTFHTPTHETVTPPTMTTHKHYNKTTPSRPDMTKPTKPDMTKPHMTTPSKPDMTKPHMTTPSKPDMTKPHMTTPSKPDMTKPHMTTPSKPDMTKPHMTTPSKPDMTKPTKPDMTKPHMTTHSNPDMTKPHMTTPSKPDMTKPTKPDMTKPHMTTSSKPDMTKPTKPDMTKPHMTTPSKPDMTKPHMTTPSKPDMTKPHMTTPSKPDMTKPHMTTPSKPDMTDHTKPDMTDHTKPDMTKPHMTTPSKPDMTKPHMTTPSKPDNTNHTKPDMTKPHMTTPSKPDMTKPTKPDITKPHMTTPSKPDMTKPDMTKPTKPDMTTPSKPDMTTPSKPDMTKPDMTTPTKPDMTKPDMATPTKPDMTKPDMATPTKPDMSTPSKPDMSTPTKPDISTPSKPDMSTPSKPDMSTPLKPDMSTPSKPDVTKPDMTPSKPDVSTSTKPDMSTPSKPDMSTPSKPDMSTPSKPDVSTPSKPDMSTPSKPDMSTPSKPDISTPSKPDVSTPSKPDMSTPSKPDMSTQTKPDMSTQTKPDMTTPTPPDMTTPDMSTPTQPDMSTRTQPDMSTQTKPDISTPTNPDMSTPTQPDMTKPDMSTPTNPDMSTPTKPDVSTPTQPDMTTPTQPDMTTPTQSDMTTPTKPESTTVSIPDPSSFTIIRTWPGGYQAKLCVKMTVRTPCGFTASMSFQPQIEALDIWDANDISHSDLPDDVTEHILTSKSYKSQFEIGDELCLEFVTTVPNKREVANNDIHVNLKFTKIDCNDATATIPTITSKTPLSTSVGSQTSSDGETKPTATTPTVPLTTSTETQATSSTDGETGTTDSSTSGTAASTTTHPPGTSSLYDFSKVLKLSILFYEAQRSGYLPADNRVPWRQNSTTQDGSDVGLDLTGGWFDAGDTIKFTLPMAASVTRLAWSLVTWQDAYEYAGQLEHMFDSIKWPLDYFLKCWNPQTKVFYVQVGSMNNDHSVWTRPEDLTLPRPSYSVSTSKPGSDVAGNAAAAMAAGSIAFKTKDPSYSDELLAAAKTLYDFAVNNKGKYSDSVSEAAEAYGSSGYEDELALAAVWLYKATKEQHYLDSAVSHIPHKVPWALEWDDKTAAAALLIYEENGEDSYKTQVDSFIRGYMPGGSVPYTPCGLAFRSQWGSLRYTANVAMLALFAADSFGGDQATSYRRWAYGQLGYMLGNNNYHISYLIGYGNLYPKNPHHTAASCDYPPAPCNWDTYNSPNPNPHDLLGALVGGPGNNDDYEDKRSDFTKNEVAVDYNAGFQAAAAGLLHLDRAGDLPEPSLTKQSSCSA